MTLSDLERQDARDPFTADLSTRSYTV